MEKPWYRRWFGKSQTPVPEDIKAKADHGDAEAQFNMGVQCASGEGGDFLQAAQWYRKAAEQDHALAQFNLGVMYAKGQGVVRDEAQAEAWFGKAALQGDAGAQFQLGCRCQRASQKGSDQEAHELKMEAFKWYRLAAAQDYKNSATACDSMTLSMSNEEVATGTRRATDFIAHRTPVAH
jgi:TPR repeat protein